MEAVLLAFTIFNGIMSFATCRPALPLTKSEIIGVSACHIARAETRWPTGRIQYIEINGQVFALRER